jgi:hypothetical protein
VSSQTEAQQSKREHHHLTAAFLNDSFFTRYGLMYSLPSK